MAKKQILRISTLGECLCNKLPEEAQSRVVKPETKQKLIPNIDCAILGCTFYGMCELSGCLYQQTQGEQ